MREPARPTIPLRRAARAAPTMPPRHALHAVLLAVLASSAPAQDTDYVTAPGASKLPEWLPLDEVAIVVNSDIVTRKRIERELRKAMATKEITTEEQFQALLLETQRGQVESLLIRQAGEDLGFEAAAIDAHIRSQIEERKDEAGGAFEMSNQLREEGETVTEMRDEIRDEVFEVSWRRRIAGYGDPAERSSEDRYVRPGKLGQRFRRIARTGQDVQFLSRAGASPAEYELQVLLLSPQAYGGLEATDTAAKEAAKALKNGLADWDELIEDLGAMDNNGVLPPLDIDRIRFGLDPGNGALLQFVMEGQLGVTSNVLPYPLVNPSTGERTIGGFALYRLLGRTPAVLPEYEDNGVQRDLQRWMQNEGDQRRWDSAIADLENIAYVWYPGIEEQQARALERRAKRLREIQEAREKNAAMLGRDRNSDSEPSAFPAEGEEAPQEPAPTDVGGE